NTWTTYSTTLPHTQTLGITSDPSGRIWTTTSGGLALRQGSTWRSFRVPESALDSHRLNDVGSDVDRTWVQGTSSLAVRGVITSPIGNFVPTISSFSPISATPGMTIIIKGNHFDDRGPDFNVVKFSNMNPFPTIQAEVISVTTTSIAVKVPALASSGPLQVEANGLKSPLSAVDFQLMPKITNISPTCLSAGSELKISGLGFMDGSAAAYVKIGSGAERIADATDPTQIRTFIRPGDTNGQVRVRLLNGNQVIASQSIAIATIQVNQTKVQQAVEGERMIWGKHTLVQLGATSQGCNGAKITRATLNWKFNTGLTVNGAILNFPGGKSLPTSLPSFSLANAVSVVGDLDISSVAGSLNLPDSPYLSSLAFFTGVDVILRNNNVDVLTVNIPKSKFNFIDTAGVRRRFTLMMVTGNTAAKQSPDFDTNMFENMAAMSRLYPQQDGYWYGGRYAWIWDTPMWISTDEKINFDPSNDNTDLARDPVDDYLDPGGHRWAIAFVDPANRNTSNSYIGLGGSGARTIVATNDPGVGGKTAIHELMHAFGFVDSDAANYQPSDVPGEDHHSKYNEGRWSNFADCKTNRTYRQALSDFTNSGNNRVVRLFTGSTSPTELRTSACSTAAGSDQGNTAKSIISYAPSRNDYNTVLEPIDWRVAIDQLCEDGGCLGYNGPLASAKPMNRVAPTAGQAATRTLRLNGVIDASTIVTTSVSYVAIDDGEVTAPDPAGQYHLIVRDASQAVLHDQPFTVIFDETAPHADVQRGSRLHEGDAPNQAAHDVAFNLRVPFPDTAVSAELVYSGTVLWAKTVSAHAPTVDLIAPNGGTFSAASPLTATWTANDADGDPLQFALEYSADDGATWAMIAPKVIGTSWSWTPNFSPASNTARVRVRASDGFNTAYSTSPVFTLTPRAPKAIILSPSAGAVLAEGDVLDLTGFSLTSDGPNQGAFTWKLNNVTVGNTRTITTPLTAIGVNTITLQVNANALSDSRSITVTVNPDYDHDGLPNDWELPHQLNPLDPTDAAHDEDGDTLSNADEYTLGTDPRSSDTDADGFSDSVEIEAGTDPLNPASVPNSNPILNVGSVSMGFTINDYSPLPGPKSTWVSNGGGGTLNFNVTKDAAWLNVSPASGTAPQELIVSANHSGLA
ncbi:MAG TPA: IPT/TIG domain-containing protein, partial [Anaerolineae bacterium]|nr:IPT/TIG domain-containing protein [Anaerolineae bacterium]